MNDKIKQAIIGLTAMAEKRETGQDLRRLVTSTAAIARKNGELQRTINGLEATQAFHVEVASKLISIQDIADGKSGHFDACDLRGWLAIAERAGVATVPARVILELNEDEMEAASGTLEVPDIAQVRNARKAITKALGEISAPQVTALPAIDLEALQERLYAAMDDIPEGWMVRSAQCGGSELKALASTGLAGETAPEVRFGRNLEVGPGWIRNGNRRRVNTSDRRTIQMHAQGPHQGAVFLARPWVVSSRYVIAEDPHRAGTAFASKGRWPMEWRAFVRKGIVEGVSVYYPQVGTQTAENARMALKVRNLAQRVVDAGIAAKQIPLMMTVEHSRRNEQVAAILKTEGFATDDFCCTLDFIETNEGLLLLEGGPGNTPVGGGHSCAFSGSGGRPVIGNRQICEGVAFKTMAHINIMEPSTWSDGDHAGAIATWEEVETLAQ